MDVVQKDVSAGTGHAEIASGFIGDGTMRSDTVDKEETLAFNGAQGFRDLFAVFGKLGTHVVVNPDSKRHNGEVGFNNPLDIFTAIAYIKGSRAWIKTICVVRFHGLMQHDFMTPVMNLYGQSGRMPYMRQDCKRKGRVEFHKFCGNRPAVSDIINYQRDPGLRKRFFGNDGAGKCL